MSAHDDAPAPDPSERPWPTPDATHVQVAVDRQMTGERIVEAARSDLDV